jgi:hypothetical protein
MSSESLAEQVIASSIKEALQFNGLLTSALEEAYHRPVSVTCLRQSEWTGLRGVLGLRRDVLLKAGDVSVVAASTLMPSSVLDGRPWLAKLGDKPLGEALKNHCCREKLPACLNMTSEVVKNGLPPVALLFDRMSWLTVEGYAYANTFRAISELDLRCAIAKGILDQLVIDDIRIGAGEIKPQATVLCLHS